MSKPEFHAADVAETNQIFTSLSRRIDHMLDTTKWAIEQYGSPEIAARMIWQTLLPKVNQQEASTLLSVALVRLAQQEAN